jgi:hypothetical protein
MIALAVADREFTDVSMLFGARLTFRHLVEASKAGTTRVQVAVTIAGPLAHFWNLALGKGIKASLQQVDRLVAAAEAASTAAAGA